MVLVLIFGLVFVLLEARGTTSQEYAGIPEGRRMKKKKKKKKKKTGCICNQPGIDGISSNSNGRIWRKPTKCSCATMYGTMGRSIDIYIYILYTILDGSGSSEMILEEQSSIAVASMKTTPKPLEVTICKTHWFRICLISSG